MLLQSLLTPAVRDFLWRADNTPETSINRIIKEFFSIFNKPNKAGVMNINLLKRIALDNGIDPAFFYAFVQVESSGYGFYPKSQRMVIRFETDKFAKYSGLSDWLKVKEGDGEVYNWALFEKASKLNQWAALMSISMGMMQIMGFNYSQIGFTNPFYMYNFAMESEENQLLMGARFINSIPALKKAVLSKDFDKTAFYYNGKNYKKYNYAERLKNAYLKALPLFR